VVRSERDGSRRAWSVGDERGLARTEIDAARSDLTYSTPSESERPNENSRSVEKEGPGMPGTDNSERTVGSFDATRDRRGRPGPGPGTSGARARETRAICDPDERKYT
jgi:hypothetical protein